MTNIQLMTCPPSARYFEDRMGWTITNIWNLLTYDVEDTVYTVCKQVLDEEDIPKDMRTTRAAAIKEIGVIFQVSCSAKLSKAALNLCPLQVKTFLWVSEAQCKNKCQVSRAHGDIAF